MPQLVLPFDDPPAEPATEPLPISHADAVRYQRSQEALDALDRLKAWLIDPRTGKSLALGEEALRALERGR